MSKIDRQFIKFYGKNKRRIFSYIFFKIRDEQVTYDLTSEVFVRLYKKLKKDDKVIKYALAWCYKTALNLVIDYTRTAYYKKTSLESDVTKESQEQNTDLENSAFFKDFDLLNQADNQEKYNKIKKALIKLNQLEREIIVFRMLEELPFKEISVIFNITEPAAKMRFKRAMDKLIKIVRNDE